MEQSNSRTAFTLTKNIHRKPYPAISPERPELSQAGKTVLVTGGGAGIGFSIAGAFLAASAARVIIIGRRKEVIEAAVKDLKAERSPSGDVVGYVCDISKSVEVSSLWDQLSSNGHSVDVLVLNAASGTPAKPLLDIGTEKIWEAYEINVRGQLQMTECFYKQRSRQPIANLYLINISTHAIHEWTRAAKVQPAYTLTKGGASLAMQCIAMDISPEEMQVVNLNPGAVLSAGARAAGLTEASFAWNDASLAGHTAVWLATPEARFLHGRFIWAAWDVDELKSGSLREEIDGSPFFLQLGVNGL